MGQRIEKVAFGGGCFWCTEAVFKKILGVQEVLSGYMGGEVEYPTYKQVCTGNTGHAEVIMLTYDPEMITFKDLLEVFFASHDPTTLNRQGADIGTQYRSVIFYTTLHQKEQSEQMINRLGNSEIFDAPIVTEITKVGVFYPAEGYHQDYFRNNPGKPYCRVVISPKLSKIKKQFDYLLPQK